MTDPGDPNAEQAAACPFDKWGPPRGAKVIDFPCGKCGGRERYVRGRLCVRCLSRREKLQRRRLARKAEVARSRLIAARGDQRTPEEESADIAVELMKRGPTAEAIIGALLVFGDKQYLAGKYVRSLKKPEPMLYRPRVHSEIPPLVVRWIMGRAGAFITRNGREFPAWGSGAIARNVQRAQGVVLGANQIRRLLWEVAPELAKRRAACYPHERKERARGRARSKAKPLTAGPKLDRE